MRAMRIEGTGRLVSVEVPAPVPGPGQVLVKVDACGVCRTDLHLLDGEITGRRQPVIPGHQVVGRVVDGDESMPPGLRVGIPWLGGTCGTCRYCRSGRENLCGSARFTGCDMDGGYAEWMVADARFCFPLPEGYSDLQAAPLLCAGLIGHRALRMAGDPATLGLYGFGSAATIIAQVAAFEGRRVLAFTRPGDAAGQEFARTQGAEWAGDSREAPPEELDAAIVFAPDGALVPTALRAVARGGVVVCAGIHMSDVPSFPYEILWGERILRSVANLTRDDARAFLALAPRIPVRTAVHAYPLQDAGRALDDLRVGRFSGAAVLQVSG